MYQYLLSLLLNNEKTEFEQEIKQYNVSPDIVEHLRKQLAQAYIAAKETSEYQKVINVIKYSNEEEALTYSKKKIATWKNQFRNGE